MQFKRAKKNEIDVNITPLIDVVFLLLIFFMVSTSFVKETHLSINLPTATNTVISNQDVAALEVLIDMNGFYRISGRSLVDSDEETLASALKNLSENNFAMPLTITADADAPYQSVVRIIDVAGALGFVQMNITTQAKEE